MRVTRKIKIRTTEYHLNCKIYDSMNDTVVMKDITVVVCRGVKLDEALKVYHDNTGDSVIDVVSVIEERESVATLDAQKVLSDYNE